VKGEFAAGWLRFMWYRLEAAVNETQERRAKSLEG